MRLFITGASGFIGGHVLRRFLRQGDEVHAMIRSRSCQPVWDSEGIAPRFHELDDSASLTPLLQEIRPDLVIHIAGLFIKEHVPADVEGLVTANVLLTTHLAEAAHRCGAKGFIHTGSYWEHAGADGDTPSNLYAATKKAGVAILRYYAATRKFRVAVLTLSDTYGNDDKRGKVLSIWQGLLQGGDTLPMSSGEQYLDLTHAEDVAEAYAVAANRLLEPDAPFYSEYGISSGRRLTLRDLAALFERIAGKRLPIQWGARERQPCKIIAPWTGYTPLPGWQPVIELEEGIARLLGKEADV